MATNHNFTLIQGETWERVVRWEQGTYVYKPITGITKAAPVVLTVPGHELLDGWRFAVSNVVGMKEINAKNEPPTDEEYHVGKFVDANSIEINALNGLGFTTYTSGGVIRYRPPEDLAGYTARMYLRKNAKAVSPYFQMTSEAGHIAINNTTKTITLKLTDEETEAFEFNRARYDLEMVRGGEVTIPMSGEFTVTKNITK